MPAGGLVSNLLQGILEEGGSSGHVRRAATPTALVRCEGDPKPQPVLVPAPACIESGENCSSPENLAKLQKFSGAVDKGMAEALSDIKTARQTFLRRSCDFRYAEFEDKGDLLENTYGPKGPLVPGGSYLFELRRWADAAFMLHRACNRGMGGCQSLIEYLKEHPEEDLAPGGVHGKAGSSVYTELRKACEVGKSRSPVPNDGPAWCALDTGLCEQKSCKKWWRKVHQGKPAPWVDDRAEYDDIKEVCNWISQEKPTSRELNKYQKKDQEDTLDLKINFCKPRWINGYCEKKHDKPKFAQCTMQGGKWCKHGKVMPGSEMDETAEWEEPFKEKAVSVEKGFISPLMALPMPSALLAASNEPTERRRYDMSRYQAFL